MPVLSRGVIFSLAAAVWLAPAPAAGVTMTLDYSYDNGFFGPGTAARATLEAAAGFYSTILNDTLSAIQLPAPSFSGSGGTIQWGWSLGVNRPDGGVATFTNRTVNADELVIFAGAKLYTDSTLALGSAGSAGVNRSGPPLSRFTTPEINQINAIEDALELTVERRGETSGFATWAGSISVDSDTNWHLNHATSPPPGKADLYTVAIHELAHALGFGVSAKWTSLVANSKFNGASASALYGGPVPLATGNSHWQEGVSSTVFGSVTSQTAAMTPGLTPGSRKRLTSLDAAALSDLGWTVIAPPASSGDYNQDGIVNAADYTVWRNSLGQGANLAADGNTSMWIDGGDFAVWKANYGEGVGSGATVSSSELIAADVPEPKTCTLLVVAGLLILSYQRVRNLVKPKAMVKTKTKYRRTW